MRRWGLGFAVALLFLHQAPSGAVVDGAGGEGAVTADLTIAGTRSVTTVNPLTLNGALSALPTANYNVVVGEVARTGTNPWSVTGRVCGPNATTPTVSDCTNRGDQLIHSVDATKTLGGSALAVSSRAVSELVSGGSGTLSAPSTSEAMSAARTLFSNSGQLTTSVYTETYTGTGTFTLTPPNATSTGTYNGFFVVTLVQ